MPAEQSNERVKRWKLPICTGCGGIFGHRFLDGGCTCGVGEEPRYTLEQVRAGLLSEAAKALGDDLQTFRAFEGIVEAALDHFTQLPAGVGADNRERKAAPSQSPLGHGAAETRSSVSADSDGNQQPQGGGRNGD